MDNDDIKEIIKIYLSDNGIDATDEHYDFAIGFYQLNNKLPTMIDFSIHEDGLLEHQMDNPEDYYKCDSSDDDTDNNNDSDMTNEMLDVKKIMSKENIQKIKLVFCDKENIHKYNSCYICYDKFVETDLIRILPCTHSFHRRCIDKQLKKQSINCPLCRMEAGEGYFINI